MLKFKNLIISFIFLTAIPAFSQIDLNQLGSPSTAKGFGDGFIGFGFVLGKSYEGDKVKYGESREFIVGLGGGYKFVTWNGIGIDAYYKTTGYYLIQDSSKILPNKLQHSSEEICLDNFGGLIFDRFYIGKFFFDGGFYFDWAFVTEHIAWDNLSSPNSGGGTSTQTIDQHLVFLNSTNCGLTFRLGSVSGLSFYFNYRLTNVFKSSAILYYGLPLPPYILGAVIGIH
jgi:hypothetical protein